MSLLTDAELGYLAGLIDGEGCINISSVQKRYYVLQVITVQTNEYLLDHWQKRTGLGTIHHMARRKGDLNHSERWHWHCSSNAAVVLLEMLQPYLVLKSEEARVALEFAKECKRQQGRFRGKGKPRLTAEMLAAREVYKNALHALKKQRSGAALDKPLTVKCELPTPLQLPLF